MRIDRERLWRSLTDLAVIGATPEGGCSRPALTDGDAEAQLLFGRWAESSGCAVTRDAIGNLFAERAGAEPSLPPVVIGSHLDTQPDGGRFDGPVGVLGALEIVRTLNDAGIVTSAPIMIAVWMNEEGARFPLPLTGSSVFAGLLEQGAAEAQAASDGPSFGEELRRLGLVGDQAVGSRALDSYFELHIEQGTILERSGVDVGIVERGQGVRALTVTITGVAAHAGTAAMTERSDALVAAASIVLAAQRIGVERSTLVTVGRLDVRPNSRATVPGEVTLVVDIRDPEVTRIDAADHAIRGAIAEAAERGAVAARVEKTLEIPVVEFDRECRRLVASGCEALGLSSVPLVSGAGHDAMSLAAVAPASLVFIPCRHGVSHHPAEYASPDQIGAGCDALLHAVVERAGIVA
ncbi:MAG: Zn-dependent hydrolase [Gaiellales bacterium]